jgi:hypothetical protein
VDDETTQLDLSAELDRLSAMQDDGGDDDPTLALVVHGARFRPDGVAGHEVRALCDDGPADLRGRRVGLALHALHREGVHAERDGERVPVETVVDAVGGPDLADGYVVDRETGAVLAATDEGLVVAESSPVGEAGDARRVDADALADATVTGFRDRPRYRRYDAYGRP